jgi:hypothetical protein
MYTLQNSSLSISVLDPVADASRMGARYCTGGYIYQVTDARRGHLLSGPQYPAPEPNTFDGQGAPDMFHNPLGIDRDRGTEEVACIGVGRFHRADPAQPFNIGGNYKVIEYLGWEVDSAPGRLAMHTQTTFHEWGYSLARILTLEDRTLTSRTEIKNHGSAGLDLRWFAHPFFPLTPDHVLCRFVSPRVRLPETPGYYLNADGYICRKTDFDWTRGGCYQVLELDPSENGLETIEKDPKVGEVLIKTDFTPGHLPIWGNQNTFSFEPYYIRALAPGEETAWTISYSWKA